MRFGAAAYLWGFLLIPALIFFFILAARLKLKAIRQFSAFHLFSLLAESHSLRKARWKKIFLLLGIFFLIISLARPQWGSQLVEIKKQGLDIMLALDVSLSMLAEDIQPNRLERAKLEIHDFMEKLQGDRIGLVTFAGAAYISCPLTLDYRAAQLFLDNVQAGLITKPGTNIAEAINTVALAFNQKEKKYKVLILVTDGEDQGHQPVEAAQEAAKEGIRIYTLGVGTPAGEPIPLRQATGEFLGYKKDETGSVVLSRLDEQTLSEIAQLGKGRYLSPDQGGFDLDQLYQEISGLEKRELQGTMAVEYRERYQYFLLLVIVCLTVEMLLTDRKRTVPFRLKVWKKVPAGTAILLFLLLIPAASAKESPSSLNSKGNKLYQEGKYQEAVKLYEEAAVDKPEEFALQYNLANALQQSQDFANSWKTYQRAVQLGDTNQQALAFYNLGNNLFRLEQYPEAVAAYKRAVELNPSDRNAKYNFELALKKMQEQASRPKKQNQKDRNQKQEQQQQNQSQQKNQDEDKRSEQKQPEQNQKQEQPEKNQQDQPQQSEEQKQKPQEKPSQSQLNQEEAKRILEALEQKEREQKEQKAAELQKRLLRQGKGSKDW
jgi:Ca-activated chloride channel family protein